MSNSTVVSDTEDSTTARATPTRQCATKRYSLGAPPNAVTNHPAGSRLCGDSTGPTFIHLRVIPISHSF